MSELTQARLHELLDYDPWTGDWTWLVARGRCAAGSRAGTRRKDGYLIIRVDGVQYLGHRLAWLWVWGEFPEGEIDHRNGVPGDDWFLNLRDVSRDVNQQNQRQAQAGNQTGLMGVSPRSSGGFRARIFFAGKEHLIGNFATAEAAHEAYCRAKRQHHAGCTI